MNCSYYNTATTFNFGLTPLFLNIPRQINATSLTWVSLPLLLDPFELAGGGGWLTSFSRVGVGWRVGSF